MRTSEPRSAARSLTIRALASYWPTWQPRWQAPARPTLDAARRRDLGRPYSQQASVAKLVATDAAMKVTTDAVQVFGGVGYTRDFRVERYMREAKITQIFEGTNQIQRLVIARGLATGGNRLPRRRHGHLGAETAPRIDVHRAAHRVEPGQQRAKPDVPVGDVLRHDRGVEAGSVVGDRQDDAIALAHQADPDRGGLRMLADVGEQLACGPVQQRLRLRLAHIVEVGFHGKFGARLELLQQFSHRRGEAELGQHLGVQPCDGGAQSGCGFLQRRVHHVECGVWISLTCLIQFEPRGQQRL